MSMSCHVVLCQAVSGQHDVWCNYRKSNDAHDFADGEGNDDDDDDNDDVV